MKPKCILIMDGDPIARRSLEKNLKAEGCSLLAAESTSDAMRLIREQSPDLLILDLALFGENAFNGISDGFSFIHWLRYALPDVNFPVIIYTADPSPAMEQKAAACQVFAVVPKNENPANLMDLIRLALAPGEAALA